ncbi:MAG: hypothetical protein FWB88_04140 [Defluviitaleaceae bacterium]|nr:hypothetical protein [Defluviitaleaceae bacterium]MCL2238787.1 hypothetical protein [Defluviitaleaceae bacterium]
MTNFDEKLTENMRTYKALENEVLPRDFTREGLVRHLRERAKKTAALLAENNALIQAHLTPLMEGPLTEAQADRLFALARALHDSNRQHSLDRGLALEIHNRLLVYAREKGDIPRQVRSLQDAGLIYRDLHYVMQLQGNPEMFADRAEAYLREGAGFAAQYFEISNETTRRPIIACMVNLNGLLAMARENFREALAPFFTSVDALLAFCHDERVRAHDPDFPWDSYITSVRLNICSWVDAFALTGPDAPERDPVLARRIRDSFHALSAPFWTPLMTEYMHFAVNYYAQEAPSPAELPATLRRLYARVDDADYSSTGLFDMGFIPFFFIACLDTYPTENPEATKQEINSVMSRVTSYFQKMPAGIVREIANDYISRFAKVIGSANIPWDTYIDLLLRFTSFGHLSTYVHAVQVQRLTEILARHFITRKPAYFIGMCGASTSQEVTDHADAILHLISRAALCHDIGKISYINTVSLHSRRLFDFEFDIIKEHIRADTLLGNNHASAQMHCLADVIKGHHKWYDGTGGYPQWFNNRASPFAFVIDMVSVADSIDAATDTVGRSYAHGLTLEQIIAEIQAQAGTRYHPEIAAALEDTALKEEIQTCLTTGREETYFNAYRTIPS